MEADACTYAGDPQLSSCRRRFQTGETREKLAHMFRLLGLCLEPLGKRWRAQVGLLGPCFKLGEHREKLAHM